MRHSRPRLRLTAALAFSLTLGLAGCSGTPGAPATGATETGAATQPTTAPEPTVTPTATATFPTDRVGAAMKWFVGQMNSDPVESDLGKRFTQEFTAQVPPEQLIVLLGELRMQGPWVTESVNTRGSNGVATLVSGQGMRFTLSMQLDADGLISGALINSAAKGTPATTWEGVVERARLGAPQVAVLAGTVDTDGALTPAFEQDADTPHPVGSMFKLYVLAAVAEKVAAGELAWDRKVTLEAGDKTLPSGTLQNEPDGTQLTVQDAATRMISQSDNTATGLLMRVVAERAVLDAAQRAGNDHLEGITPFLTAKQMFWLTGSDSAEAQRAREQWADAPEAKRRELLAAVPMPGPGPQFDATTVQWPTGVEWFVSARDIVDVHVYLEKLSTSPSGAALQEILTANSGIPVSGWTRTAFKGGSNVGVIALSFYARAGDGDDAPRQVLVMMGRGDAPVDENTFIAATQDAANLLVEKR